MRCAPLGILDIFRIAASAAHNHSFPRAPAHLPVEPVRVEGIDAHGLLDPINRFVGAANIQQHVRTHDEDMRVAGVQAIA